MEGVAQAAAIASDPDAAVAARVRALVEVVDAIVAADGALPLPESMLDAIDDLALLDAAVAAHHGSAVCALLHLIGPRPELVTSRRRVVRRLIAAGVTGAPLAGLAFALGEVAAGAALAIRDFGDHVAPRVGEPAAQPIVDAWLRWLASQPDPAIAAVLRGIAEPAAALAHVTNLEAADRLRAITQRMLAP